MTITGELLQKMRTLRGVKQQTMAQSLGIQQSTYCELERSPCIKGERLEKILAVLEFTHEDVEALKRFLPPPLN